MMGIIVCRPGLLSLAAGTSLALLVGCSAGRGAGSAQTESVTIRPPDARLLPLGTETFAATVRDPATSTVQWTVREGAVGGSVTSGGVYTAPASPGIYHVLATSDADSSKFATATITVTPDTSGISVTVTPDNPHVPASGSQQFTATVTGTSDTAVVWTLREGASCGSISASGFYTAPASSAICHAVVASVVDGTKTGSATVTVDGGAGTNIAAGPLPSQTWTPVGSPYRIYGDVYVPGGNRLTIKPGVQVRFQGHYRLEGPGVIDARGTSSTQRDILFTAEDTVAGWYGIRIWNGSGTVGAPPDVSDYHLENCIIEYVVKDRSRPRSFGDSIYNDSRGALYVYGATAYSAGAPENYSGLKYSDLHLNGLMLRHNRALSNESPHADGAAIYFNTFTGTVQPIWTDLVFDDNQTVRYGGAIAMHHVGPITFRNSVMTNNVATSPEQPGAGGAIGYWDVSGPITLDHVTYSGNTPADFATQDAPSVVVVNPP